MSIFNQKSKFKVKTEVRKVKQAVTTTSPAPQAAAKKTAAAASAASNGRASSVASLNSRSSSARPSPIPPTSVPSKRQLLAPRSSTSPETSHYPGKRGRNGTVAQRLLGRAGSNRSSRSPASPSFSDSEPGSDDDDDDWRDRLDPHKRRKRAHTETVEDPARRLRHPRLWTGRDGDGGVDGAAEERLAIVHSADVASLEDKCQPVMGLGRDEVGVRLRYPGSNFLEM